MTKQQFKYIDLFVFCIFALLCEIAGNILVDQLNSMFYISFASLIAIIAMLRWGPLGVVVYIAAGLYSFVVSTATMELFDNILFNIVVNLFIMIPSLFLLKKNRDVIIKSEGKLVIYMVLCYLSLSVGKGAAIYLINGAVDGFLSYIGSQTFVIVVSIILGVVLSKKTEIVCDMDEYLIRINKEKEEGRVIE